MGVIIHEGFEGWCHYWEYVGNVICSSSPLRIELLLVYPLHIFFWALCCFCLIDVRGAPNGTSTLHIHELPLSGVLLKHVGSHVATTDTIRWWWKKEASLFRGDQSHNIFSEQKQKPYSKNSFWSSQNWEKSFGKKAHHTFYFLCWLSRLVKKQQCTTHVVFGDIIGQNPKKVLQKAVVLLGCMSSVFVALYCSSQSREPRFLAQGNLISSVQ